MILDLFGAKTDLVYVTVALTRQFIPSEIFKCEEAGISFPARVERLALGLSFPARVERLALGLSFQARVERLALGLSFPARVDG